MRWKLIMLGASLFVASLASADKGIIKEVVNYSCDGVKLEGYCARPFAGGKYPVVLIVHDWNGLDSYEKGRADMLARMGYVAFAVDVYGKGVRPATVEDCQKESAKYYANHGLLMKRLGAAYERAKTLTSANPSKVAAIGYCFGGMSALEMARAGTNLAGVVSFHGSLATGHPAKKGQVKAPLLVLHGANDPFVPQKDVDALKKEMSAAGASLKFIAYPGAVHAFTIKGVDSLGLQGAAYNENADKQSWAEMVKFFSKVLK